MIQEHAYAPGGQYGHAKAPQSMLLSINMFPPNISIRFRLKVSRALELSKTKMEDVMKRIFSALLVWSLGASAAPADFPICVPPAVSNIGLSLMLSNSIPNDNPTWRREFVMISDDLADALGIEAGDIEDEEVDEPNPQIRVRIQSAPAASGITNNSAVFTVVGINPDNSKKIWVYRQDAALDKDSGEYKLLGTSGNGSVYAAEDEDAPLGVLDEVVVRADRIPVSRTTFTSAYGFQTVTNHYRDPSASQRYSETAVARFSDRMLVMAPHGGDIETDTSTQANDFAAALQLRDGTLANVWNVEGRWGSSQTFARWHITATSIDVASYPGLANLIPNDADDKFDWAVAFHGFSDDEVDCPGTDDHPPFYQIVLGGSAARELKCAIAQSIYEALDGILRAEAIAIDIRGGGNIDIPDACGRYVSIDGDSGPDGDNIVNRLAANGGIQLEQSKALRDDEELRDLVAAAVADGLVDYEADPDGYCAAFPLPLETSPRGLATRCPSGRPPAAFLRSPPRRLRYANAHDAKTLDPARLGRPGGGVALDSQALLAALAGWNRRAAGRRAGPPGDGGDRRRGLAADRGGGLLLPRQAPPPVGPRARLPAADGGRRGGLARPRHPPGHRRDRRPAGR